MSAIEGMEVPVDAGGRPYPMYYHHVTSEFFTALRIPLRRGRAFDQGDRPGTPAVVVVNESMAGDLFGSANPLGRRLRFNGANGEAWHEIVGVVADVRNREVAELAAPAMYLSFDQSPRTRMEIVARATAPDATLPSKMREQLWEVRSDLPVRRSGRMSNFVAQSIVGPRFYALLLGGFAGVALVLALVGIYGTLSYTVSLRSREVGIRIALGASSATIQSRFLRRGLTQVGYGIVLGIGGALLATRALESFVFGVTPTDPITMVLGVTTVLAAALPASVVPARRAARLDPMVVLRNQ